MGLLILDRQHVGDPSDPGDVGAVLGDLVEAELTPVYIEAARDRAELAGLDVAVLDSGRYSERHAAAVRLARGRPDRVAYVACHLNAGKDEGWRPAAFFDHRSRGGAVLAADVTARLGRGRAFAARSGDWTGNAFATIRGVYEGPANLSGLCFEPLYLEQLAAMTSDCERRQALERAGRELGAGVATWCARWTRRMT
jgi:hypothetical protein